MSNKFEGTTGGHLLHEALLSQKIAGGQAEMARALAAAGNLMEVKASTVLIEQDATDDDMYLILSGSFDVLVNRNKVGVCRSGDHVGEMSPMHTAKRRTATVVAAEDSIVLRLPEAEVARLGEKYPHVWRHLAKELVRRLDHRNAARTKARDRMRILIIAPPTGMDVARAVEKVLDHCTVQVWPEGVFRSAKYSIASLEEELDESDFAVAVVPPGESAGERDNVIFELGFFIGRLGRNRTLLLEPRAEQMDLPSDLKGLTTLGYRTGAASPEQAVAPACERLRAIVAEWGPRS